MRIVLVTAHSTGGTSRTRAHIHEAETSVGVRGGIESRDEASLQDRQINLAERQRGRMQVMRSPEARL